MPERYFKNLSPAINKDPQAEGSLYVTSTDPHTIVIKDGTLIISNLGVYNLAEYTINSLAAQLNSLPNISCTVIAYPQISALSLLDGTYVTPISLQSFTSILWQLATAIEDQFVAIEVNSDQAQFQITPLTSSANWLDSAGRFYGVLRQPGEPDELYSTRIIDFSIGQRVNNIAIQKILANLGYVATITDITPYPSFNAIITLPTVSPSGYVYSIASLADMINTLKAEGVTANVILQGTFIDLVHASEALSYSTNSKTWTWDNFVWGKFNW